MRTRAHTPRAPRQVGAAASPAACCAPLTALRFRRCVFLTLSARCAALPQLLLLARLFGVLLLRPCVSAMEWRAWACGLGETLRPGGAGSLVLAFLLHLLPYATQDRQTFLLYYLPAYYFAILLLGRAWHALVCTPLRPPVALAATLALAHALGRVSWRLAPLAYASPVHVHEWRDALRLASTECWAGPVWEGLLGERECWVDAAAG